DPEQCADTKGMTKIRNLPLAVRLAGAFGALVLALLIIAFAGTRAMSGISGKADGLAHTNLKSAELLAEVQMYAKDDVSLGEQHLYLHDGQLAVEDGIARKIASNNATIAKDSAQINRLFAGSSAAGAFANYDQLRNQLVDALATAIQRSRQETV